MHSLGVLELLISGQKDDAPSLESARFLIGRMWGQEVKLSEKDLPLTDLNPCCVWRVGSTNVVCIVGFGMPARKETVQWYQGAVMFEVRVGRLPLM